MPQRPLPLPPILPPAQVPLLQLPQLDRVLMRVLEQCRSVPLPLPTQPRQVLPRGHSPNRSSIMLNKDGNSLLEVSAHKKIQSHNTTQPIIKSSELKLLITVFSFCSGRLGSSSSSTSTNASASGANSNSSSTRTLNALNDRGDGIQTTPTSGSKTSSPSSSNSGHSRPQSKQIKRKKPKTSPSSTESNSNNRNKESSPPSSNNSSSSSQPSAC